MKYSKVSDTSVEIKDVVTTKVTVTGTPQASAIIYDKDTKQLVTKVNEKNEPTKRILAASDAVFFSSTDGKGKEYKAYNLRSLGNISTTSSTDVYSALNDDNDEVVAAFADLGNKPSGSSSNTEYGMVISVEKSVKVDDSYYNKYVVWTGAETTIFVKSDNFEKGDYVYFDKTSDDTYTSGEVKKVATTGEGNTVIWTVKYDQKDKLLTYKTAADAENNTTKAVEDDLKIVYVNRADKKAGSDVGIGKYDEVTKYANAIYIDEDKDGKIDAIIVDENNDILDKDGANVATTTYTATGKTANGEVVTVSPNTDLAKNSNTKFTFTFKNADDTAFGSDGTRTLTVSGLKNTKTVTISYTSGQASATETVTDTVTGNVTVDSIK